MVTIGDRERISEIVSANSSGRTTGCRPPRVRAGGRPTRRLVAGDHVGGDLVRRVRKRWIVRARDLGSRGSDSDHDRMFVPAHGVAEAGSPSQNEA
jgi:hypothetical protein